jgi:hypothetical protein
MATFIKEYCGKSHSKTSHGIQLVGSYPDASCFCLLGTPTTLLSQHLQKNTVENYMVKQVMEFNL